MGDRTMQDWLDPTDFAIDALRRWRYFLFECCANGNHERQAGALDKGVSDR